MKTNEISHAIWMLSEAVQALSSTISAIERNDIKMQVDWLTHAVDCICDAEKAIEDSKILPF